MLKFKNEKEGYELEVMFYYGGIQFDDLETMVRVFKTAEPEATKERMQYYYWDLQTDEKEYLELVDKALELWDTVKPFTAKEVFSLENAEQRYLLLSLLDPADVAEQMEPVLIDRQVLKKKHERTVLATKKNHKITEKFSIGDVKRETVEFDDIYELYKIDKNKFGINNDLHYVKCKDTSTDRVYCIYVDSTVEQCQTDAIEAIAWTMVDEQGNTFTKEQYLQFVSES